MIGIGVPLAGGDHLGQGPVPILFPIGILRYDRMELFGQKVDHDALIPIVVGI